MTKDHQYELPLNDKRFRKKGELEDMFHTIFRTVGFGIVQTVFIFLLIGVTGSDAKTDVVLAETLPWAIFALFLLPLKRFTIDGFQKLVATVKGSDTKGS